MHPSEVLALFLIVAIVSVGTVVCLACVIEFAWWAGKKLSRKVGRAWDGRTW
jgi:hypothetical protein